MKTYRNLYGKLCSLENLTKAYQKAKRGKTRKESVIAFTEKLEANLKILHEQLTLCKYKPRPLRKFIIRDPKTRTIHASAFRDRVVHHAIINILEPIFEPRFIHDSFASRKNKGTLSAVLRFEQFKRKVTQNGQLVSNAQDTNSIVGYVFKADVRHFFDTVDHEMLLSIIRSKVTDEKIIWLITQILNNFETNHPGKGMPLGNYTSQFFANVYLTKLDYFVKHTLKAKYYIRYVDDLVILHRNKDALSQYARKINLYLQYLKLQLHPDKSSIAPMKNGVPFLGYRVFFRHRLLRKRNLRHFMKKFETNYSLFEAGGLSEKDFLERLQGWFGYARWAQTYKLREKLKKRIVRGGRTGI